MSAVATSPRWWFGTLFILLAALIFTPVIQVPRWPTWPFSRTELTSISTTLRLQFNAVGRQPEEIETHKIHWTSANYDERRKETPDRKYVCDPNTINTTGIPNYSSAIILGQSNLPNCSYVDFPNYHEVINTILFLTFDQPISAKHIKLNPHGAELPKYDIDPLSEKLGTIYFQRRDGSHDS